jgi:glutamyl-Q tRNA(Asp) synthetase
MPRSPELQTGRDDRGLFSPAAVGGYRGRFAPSPTGPLHAGSMVAALASWLDARAHGGVWLLRIEDIDKPRCVPGAARHILAQLAACGLVPDEGPSFQSGHFDRYATALTVLLSAGRAFACGCSRKDIETAWAAQGVVHAPGQETPYPGTCRTGLHGQPPRAWRFLVNDRLLDDQSIDFRLLNDRVDWTDRRLGPQHQTVAQAVGDFVLKRADGLWAYQLAVVVDDAAQSITHVVRGEDLVDNTARQILLQRALKLPTPAYLHTPLVLAADGNKLSKQNGAVALDVSVPLAPLQAAAVALQLPALQATQRDDWLAQAVLAWRDQSTGIIAAFTTKRDERAEDDSA